ncbi:SRPBCC family protein [Rathayibacter sp. VKM Ac-2754]|uniref:SRPBCC family protein n=1 Tax=Rathayibacter sp. VKM Ac-2754 TaxID=2609251 RepID=UPI001359C123|nr:SRPBCC family protein [Rathayibacter sp. VKM Ac-2754]MWV58055.1 Clp protease [Rathayibacter sp. VKM Ac-2754]
MSKFARVAQTSQSLSLAAMEEASRLGLREADLEHLLLALVISDQSAGRALRSLQIDLAAARRAVQAQHAEQLASLGIDAPFPESGRIVLHETSGYEWSRRAADLLARAGGTGKGGDAAAVLRELVAEPSGQITDLLRRLGTTPDAVLARLDRFDSPETTPWPAASGRASGSTEAFVPAPIEDVWALVADPLRVPEWELSVGHLDDSGQDVMPGAVWQGHARLRRPDGKPVRIKPRFRRKRIELVELDRPEHVAWRVASPDAPRSSAILTEFSLTPTTGGTQVTIAISWPERAGWRRLVGWPLRPLRKFLVWIVLFQTTSAISRPFR